MGEDREQEGEPRREEALREDARWLARGVDEGAEGLEREGLRCGEREERAGPGLVREGEVFLLEVSEGRMSDAYLRPNPTAGARSGKWGSPAACLSEGCLLV